jgi:hypothetical protein
MENTGILSPWALGNELVRDAGAVGVDHRGAAALALQALVALDPLLGVVLGLAFLPRELHAIDAAVALVDEREVVDEAVGDRDAARRVRAGAIHEQRHEDVLPCASAGPAAGPTASAAINSPINVFVVFMRSSSVTG